MLQVKFGFDMAHLQGEIACFPVFGALSKAASDPHAADGFFVLQLIKPEGDAFAEAVGGDSATECHIAGCYACDTDY